MNSQITFQFLSIKTRWLCFFSWWCKNSSQISFFLHYIGNWIKKLLWLEICWIFLPTYSFYSWKGRLQYIFLVKISLKVTGTSMIIMCKFSPPKNVSTFLIKKIGSHFKEGAGCVVSRSRTLWSFMTWKFSMQEKALFFRKLSFHDTIIKKEEGKKLFYAPFTPSKAIINHMNKKM